MDVFLTAVIQHTEAHFIRLRYRKQRDTIPVKLRAKPFIRLHAQYRHLLMLFPHEDHPRSQDAQFWTNHTEISGFFSSAPSDASLHLCLRR